MDHQLETAKVEVTKPFAQEADLAEKTVGIEQDKLIRQYVDAPAERVSLKAKLVVMKAKVAVGDTEKPMPQKVKGKEETLKENLKFFIPNFYSHHVIIILVGDKSWVKEHTNGY